MQAIIMVSHHEKSYSEEGNRDSTQDSFYWSL